MYYYFSRFTLAMSISSPLFRGCLLPSNFTQKTFLQLRRESEEAKNEKFLIPVERSTMQDISAQLSSSREMADIWCPGENYEADIQFIEEVTSMPSIVDSLKKYEVTKDRTPKVLASSPETKKMISQLESELSPRPLLYCQPVPAPARPDVLGGELFPPVVSMVTEDMISMGARRLLNHLDNPDRFLRRLPSLPLPVWSNTRGRESRVVEKMETEGGHLLMRRGGDVDRYGLGFEENGELSRSRLYRQKVGVEGRERWEQVVNEEMEHKVWMMGEGANHNEEYEGDKLTGMFNSPV